jgi:hypothetical protein
MDSATEKLELGLARLARAGDDADLLGLALQSIHGALEDRFRARLAADEHVPADQRAAIADPKRVQWKELLDAMQLYADLGAPEREQIWHMNAARTKVAHGGRYAGGRAELERYAALAQSLLGYTAPPRPARAPAEKPAKPAGAQAKPARPRAARADDDIPRAVRVGAAAPARPRSRLGWSGVLLALALLFGLAGFVVLRSAAQSRAQPTAIAAPTSELAPTSAGQASAAPQPPPRSAVVAAADGLNLRADHSLAAGVIASLPNGTRVAVVGGPVAVEGFEWWNVEAGGRRGWCAGAFLTFD